MTLNLNRLEENDLDKLLNSDEMPVGENKGAELVMGKGGVSPYPSNPYKLKQERLGEVMMYMLDKANVHGSATAEWTEIYSTYLNNIKVEVKMVRVS